MTTNESWFRRAEVVLSGGVDSPVRSFRSVGGTPYTVTSGAGAYVTDVEGTRYLDMVQSYGASLLGHAHPTVTAALHRAVDAGSTFGAPTMGEVLLAEAITARVSGVEQVRFVSSGTEAVMTAVRLARGATGRSTLVKFEGCYHGHSDALLVAAGSGAAQMTAPDSAGVTSGAIADTVIHPYNDVPTLAADTAAVIVEPVAANMNLVAPREGFLAGLRAECDRVGALLIFDEVITGFRLHLGGAAAVTGVTPDLWCFGKVIGGGLPVGAVAGPRALLHQLAPLGDVYQAGTLSGNPVAMAAGLAVLTAVTSDDLEELTKKVERFADRARVAIESNGLTAWVPTVGPLCGLYLSHERCALPQNFGEARTLATNGLYSTFFHHVLDQGVALAPGPYEIMFVSLSHEEDDLERAAEIFGRAAAATVRT